MKKISVILLVLMLLTVSVAVAGPPSKTGDHPWGGDNAVATQTADHPWGGNQFSLYWGILNTLFTVL